MLLALVPKQVYTDKTIFLLFVEVELILNSELLTSVKFNDVIEKPLTPNNLLLLKPSTSMAPNFTTNENSFSKSRSTQTKGSADTFWKMRIK